MHQGARSALIHNPAEGVHVREECGVQKEESESVSTRQSCPEVKKKRRLLQTMRWQRTTLLQKFMRSAKAIDRNEDLHQFVILNGQRRNHAVAWLWLEDLRTLWSRRLSRLRQAPVRMKKSRSMKKSRRLIDKDGRVRMKSVSVG